VNWKAILAGGLSVGAIAVIGIAVAGSPSSPTPAASVTPTSVSASPTAAPASVSADPMASIPAPSSMPVAQPAGQEAPLPTSVSIPALKVMSTLIPLGVNPDLTVQVPPLADPGQAGWFDLGVRPGEIGSAVLLGHVDGSGEKGVFFAIHTLNLGDLIVIGHADGSTATFKVTRVRTVLKSAFPSSDAYGPKPDAEIQLITCGGELDRAAHNFLSSVIVTGVLVS
jgi:sortase (surface protein transpeptidase)